MSKAFASWKEYKGLEPVLDKLNLTEKVPDLKKLKERV
jgi:hypothetical protein